MKATAVAEVSGSRPARLDLDDFIALREMLACVNTETGPILKASTFLGAGATAGGGYAGHAEVYNLDALLRKMYNQPSMEPGVNDTLFGGGKGFNLEATMLSTIGEAVERVMAALVSCSPYLPSQRLLASFDQLSERGLSALDPETLGLFSEQQYSQPHFLYRRFDRQVSVQWVEGTRLRSREPVLVPSQLVDMVHLYEPGEEIIGYPVSGGLSCHASRTAAIFHGLTEVIERDAVNVSWYTDRRPGRLRIDDDVRRVLGPFCDRLLADHSLVEILWHESDLCSAPTFSIVGIQDWLKRRQYCAGGGCDVVAETALKKAAAEFGQSRSTLALAIMAPRSAVGRSVETMFDWEPDRPLAEMDLFFQAIGYYGLDQNLSHLDYYLSGPERSFSDALEQSSSFSGLSSLEDRLERLLAELGAHGIDPIVFDYSHPSWNKLSVAKVYVPELTTPFLQSRPMLGHERLSGIRPELQIDHGHVLPLPYP